MKRSGVPFLIVPVVGAIAALFLVLPRTGADARVKITPAGARVTYELPPGNLAAGQRIEIRNETRATHTFTCLGCAVDSGDIQPDQSVFITVPDAGSFTFSCRYHADRLGENATLTVSR